MSRDATSAVEAEIASQRRVVEEANARIAHLSAVLENDRKHAEGIKRVAARDASNDIVKEARRARELRETEEFHAAKRAEIERVATLDAEARAFDAPLLTLGDAVMRAFYDELVAYVLESLPSANASQWYVALTDHGLVAMPRLISCATRAGMNEAMFCALDRLTHSTYLRCHASIAVRAVYHVIRRFTSRGLQLELRFNAFNNGDGYSLLCSAPL